MLTQIEEVEQLISGWQEPLGEAREAYKNHIYRVINLCACQRKLNEEALHQVVIAACFHDIAIWLDDTFDYLSPSCRYAQGYLEAEGLGMWQEVVTGMIEHHHKITPYQAGGLVELFRRADWIDVTFGLRNFGVAAGVIREIRMCFPNAGFHAFLLRRTARELVRRPWRPLPMIRW